MKKLFVLFIIAGAGIGACNNETTATPPTVASVTMVPTATVRGCCDTMLVATSQLAAVLKDAGGNVISVIQTGQSVAWTSSDTTAATVSQAGIGKVRALASATITAAIEGKSATATITGKAPASVSVTPTPDSVSVGKTVTLTATTTSATGDTLPTREMFWTSSDTSLAIVSNADTLKVAPGNSGKIKGVKVGTVTITARVGAISGTATVKVQ
ncbi:MAG TPA: Ig-like domain-containing protein [Gemmatimonadales bacterium]|nr:Ig-like domain-containing protein [Gemmatimonadales bacterium]